MDKRGKKMEKIARLAEVEEQRFGKLAGKCRAELQKQLQRLDELADYRNSYTHCSVDNIDAAHWQDFQNFIRRLDQAVRSQQEIVRECERNFELHRRQWLEKRRRRETLENIVERQRRDELAHEERLEQRKLDDLPRSPQPYRKRRDE